MFFTLLLHAVFLTATGESVSENGWRPISRERVFNARNFIKTEVNADMPPSRPELTDTFADEQIKLPDGRGMFDEGFYPRVTEQENDEIPTFADVDASYDSFLETEIPLKLNNSRKAKTINNQAYTAKENIINDVRKATKVANVKDENVNKYENVYSVTEDDNNDISADHTTINQGYNYIPIKEEPTNSLTENFLKILSNYNIRSSDKLPNYSLSLRQNSRHSSNDKFMYINVPMRIPVSYNSPNHLLVDPLLAVLLSNYGYYLPGLYGVPGNYRNLYGYAAANNIHNNKPFGSYKIYSDTDSYN